MLPPTRYGLGIRSALLRLALVLVLLPATVCAETRSTASQDLVRLEKAYLQAERDEDAEQAQKIARDALLQVENDSSASPRALTVWLLRNGRGSLLSEGDARASIEYYQRACSTASRLERLTSLKPECLAGIAQANFQAGQLDQAAKIANQAIEAAGQMDAAAFAAASAFRTIAEIALQREDPVKAGKALQNAAHAFSRGATPLDANLAFAIEDLSERIGGDLSDKKDVKAASSVVLSGLNTLAALVGPKNERMISALSNASRLTIIQDGDSIKVVQWLADAVIANPGYALSQDAMSEALSDFSMAHQPDQGTKAFWAWVAAVESRFGALSVEKARALAEGGEWLSWSGNFPQSNDLYEKALKITSQISPIAEDYKSIMDIIEKGKARQRSVEKTESEIRHLEIISPATNPVVVPSAPAESSSSKPEVAKKPEVQLEDPHARIDSLVTEIQTKPSRSKLQHLVQEYFEIIKPEPYTSEVRAYATRLLDAGIDVAKKSNITNNASFALLIEQKGSMFSEKDPEQAFSILDDGLAVAQSLKDDPDVIAKLLGNYASLYWLPPPPTLTPDQSRLLNGTLDRRYKQLLALANDPSNKTPEAGEQLEKYGAAYEVFEQFDNASRALEAAEKVLKASNKDDFYKGDLDDIAGRLIRVRAARAGAHQSKSAPEKSEAASAVEEGRAILNRIEKSSSELRTFTVRNDIYFAAEILADKPGGLDPAIEVYRKLLSIEVDALREIFAKSPMTRDWQLASEKKSSFQDHSFEYLQLMARNAVQKPVFNERYVNEAVSLLQWRSAEAADALIRSATRAALDEMSAGDAGELDKNLRKWRELQKAGGLGDASDIKTASELQITFDRATRLQNQLSATSAVYRKLSGYETLGLSDIRRALRPDEAWIYAAYNQIDGLVVIIVTQKVARLLQKSQSAIGDLPSIIASLKTSIANEHIRVDDAEKVYDAIIAPIEPLLDGITQITIVPEQELLTIPFPALIANKAVKIEAAEWLAQRFAITIVPSTRAFISLRAQGAPAKDVRSFVGFANPVVDQGVDECPSFSAFGVDATKKPSDPNLLCPLPTTEDQISGIAQNLQVKGKPVIITGPLMTASAVQDALSQPTRIVAFATHGLLSSQSARIAGLDEPSLLLSKTVGQGNESRWLTTSKISALSIDADLVILSACNSGASAIVDGEALSGLALAFFEAGARGVFVTNWFVNAYQTDALLRQVALALGNSSSTLTSRALQRAMISQIHANPQPSSWAMFTYVGR